MVKQILRYRGMIARLLFMALAFWALFVFVYFIFSLNSVPDDEVISLSSYSCSELNDALNMNRCSNPFCATDIVKGRSGLGELKFYSQQSVFNSYMLNCRLILVEGRE